MMRDEALVLAMLSYVHVYVVSLLVDSSNQAPLRTSSNRTATRDPSRHPDFITQHLNGGSISFEHFLLAMSEDHDDEKG
jgi:hypothetical protein